MELNDTKKHLSIIERIVRNDCTIEESDFYPPPDNRYLKSDVSNDVKCYKYYERFNEIGEEEDFFDYY